MAPLPRVEVARVSPPPSALALLDYVPTEAHDVVRRAFVGAVVASLAQESSGEALAELRRREIGPAWLRALVDEHPVEALRLMARTVRWVQRQRGRLALGPLDTAHCPAWVRVAAG